METHFVSLIFLGYVFAISGGCALTFQYWPVSPLVAILSAFLFWRILKKE